MEPTSQSWGTVEEMVLIDTAIWKSEIGTQFPRGREEAALVDDAVVTSTEKGVTTLKIGRLRWELTPPVNYSGYCEKKEDWMVVSGSKFKLAVGSPHGSTKFRPLQVCPPNDEVAFLRSQALLPLSLQKLGLRDGSRATDAPIDHLDVDDKLTNNLLTRFFDAKETTASQRIIGENFSTAFLKSVDNLQSAESLSDVLETILALSAAYDKTLQALPQEQEETCDMSSYFYDEQDWEEGSSCKSGSLWVRRQVNRAARKCQTAAAATAEVADLGARIFVDLYTKPSEVPHAFQGKRDDKPASDVVEGPSNAAMDECSDEVDPASSPSLPFEQDALVSGLSTMVDHSFSLDCNQFEIGDMGDGTIPTKSLLRSDSFGSSWQSDFGNDSSSESSWEVVRQQKNESTGGDEADTLANELSDAESLEVMLRDIDPFGQRECSSLINEFFSLKMDSATCSADDSDQEQSSGVQDGRVTKVLERLRSYSSSISSDWSDHDTSSSASSAKKKRASPLQTLAEEPACDPDIARIFRSYVFRAATEGDVLQWCACKFNKLRCSIELRFQVGAFMEDDISTLSTGISRESPLYVEIFLDPTNMRESLLRGDVRVSAHQGDRPVGYGGSWKQVTEATAAELPPVAGLSCYIPHLVRQYLRQEVLTKRASSGYGFPDGELITGLVQYVVAQLVFIKYTCCVCNHETQSDVLTSIVPRPCEKSLCQALYGAWLAVAPPAVVELSTLEDWLQARFDEDPLYDAFMTHQMAQRDTDRDERTTWADRTWKGTYKEKVQRVAKVLGSTILGSGNSWLKLAIPKPEVDDEFNEPKETAPTGEPRFQSWSFSAQSPKRRRTLSERNDDVSREKHTGSAPPPSIPVSNDDYGMFSQQGDVSAFEFDYSREFVFTSAPSPMRARRDFPGPNINSLKSIPQPPKHTSTSGIAQRGESSSSMEASGPADHGWTLEEMLEDLQGVPSQLQAPRMTRVQELRMSAQADSQSLCKSPGKRTASSSTHIDPVPASWEDLI